MLKNNILQTKGITMKNKVNSKLEWIRNFFFDSRKDGADRIGVTANYLCQIETGTKVPRLKGLCKFSYAYGIPLDILFSDERRFLIYSIEAMSALSEKSEIRSYSDKIKVIRRQKRTDYTRRCSLPFSHLRTPRQKPEHPFILIGNNGAQYQSRGCALYSIV